MLHHIKSEHCAEDVIKQINILRNHAAIFKAEIAFDPQGNTKPVTKFERYRNGWVAYGIHSDIVGISEDELWSYNFCDKNGVEQSLRINKVDGDILEVLHEQEVVAKLSTPLNFNTEEVVNKDYCSAVEKMVILFNSAKMFQDILNGRSDFSKTVTLYEFTSTGDLKYEEEFKLKLTEDRSKVHNYLIDGEFSRAFADAKKGMHGHVVNGYTYPINSDSVSLTTRSVSAVM